MVSKSRRVNAALAQEIRAKTKVLSALGDEQFMSDVREAQKLAAEGATGEPWREIKKRLGLV